MSRWIPILALLLVSQSLIAGPRHRAVPHPAPFNRQTITAIATKVADHVSLSYAPRLHWENAVYLDGLVLLADQVHSQVLLDRAASVLLNSDDSLDDVYWGDGTAYSQAALDLYRVLPPSDARRQQLLALLAGPMRFAEHAIRDTPATAAPRDPWWIAGGYGTRFWQDDLYMVVPWLALYGSSQDGLPANELARNLAYEWIEAYVYEHRPSSADAVPSVASRRGPLLWDPATGFFQHSPELIGSSTDFWGRGNGWALVTLARAAESLDAPYTGGRYDQVLRSDELLFLLRQSAQSLVAQRSDDDGWGAFLANPQACGGSETSATGLLTFFLARGVNDGWLDRATYVPIVMRAYRTLLSHVDIDGYVTGIQPPDIGPNCAQKTSREDPFYLNLNYGPGALLLATSEVLKFSDEELATR